MVLKPSEMTPLTSIIFTEIMRKAGVPKACVSNACTATQRTAGQGM
jgi:acyl-CoA reductase-like NAD-dependent aldehyde dehydrogenase